jgi:hypothetical protein
VLVVVLGARFIIVVDIVMSVLILYLTVLLDFLLFVQSVQIVIDLMIVDISNVFFTFEVTQSC